MNNRLLTIFLVLAIPTLIVKILIVGQPVLMPFVIAVFVVFLLNATAEFYEKLKVPWTVLRYTLAFITLVLFICTPLYLTIQTIPEVLEAAPHYQATFQETLLRYSEILPTDFSVADLTEKISLSGLITSLAVSLGTFASDLIVILIYIGFILAEQKSVRTRLVTFLADGQNQQRVASIISSSGAMVRIYLRVKTAASIMVALFTYVALKTVGVDFAEFWATICFFLNFIPSIGSLLGIALPTLMALVQFGVGAPLAIVLVVVGAAQLIISNVVEPKLMGQSMNMSPLAIILALFVFGAVWGIVGAFLSVPLLVIIMLVAAQFERTRPLAMLLSADGRLAE